jgi:hypothetical protein
VRILLEHKIFSSFVEWFEHTLLSEGRAFFNYSSPVYPMVDPKRSIPTYSSPFYQWIYDNSISGVTVPTATGLGVSYVDYENGRVLTSGAAPVGSISYSVKDLNIYTTSSSDATLIMESKYNLRPEPRSIPPTSGLAPYQKVAPCIFLKAENRQTEPIAFGGTVYKKMDFSAIIVSDDDFKRYGVGTIFCNRKDAVFPYFDDSPINAYGDVKSPYNYETRANSNDTVDRLVCVKNVRYTPIEVDSVTQKSPNLYFGKIYFECWFFDNLNNRFDTA